MEYVALLRGINVGKTKRINMKSLKNLFENIGYTQVSTYINSGNVFFKSSKSKQAVLIEIMNGLLSFQNEEIKILVKSIKEIKKIADAIPREWKNNAEQRTDVAYLFKSIDRKQLINDLPVKRAYIDILYIPGALIWNVKRKNYNKSQLSKLISYDIYQQMTIRNANTARYLAFRE
jgi:uncharacterized protein (DUF1697 family)